VTRTREFFHCDQMPLIPIQNSFSNGASIGLCFRCLKSNSCWRRARFSLTGGHDENKSNGRADPDRAKQANMSLIYIRSRKTTERKLLQTQHGRILPRDSRPL
jgi:hypothetical protein